MKNIFKLLSLFSTAVFFILLPMVSKASSLYGDDLYAEKINDYAVSIDIKSNASIDVTENIVYDFGLQERHGIYRYIPYKYKARGGNFSLRFSDFKVVDEQGNKYNYTTSTEGSNYYLKIGDADVYVTGVHTYKISYRVDRALNYFEDWDELYWNVTGNEWDVPILKSSALITLPQGVEENDFKIKCYTGSYGSTQENCQADVASANQVKFTANSEFNPNQGLTIVLGWPKKIVTEPSAGQKLSWVLWDNISLFIAPLVFLIVFFYWYTRGRDPKVSGPIVAEYDAPDQLTPIEMATLVKDRIANKYISAQLISLAIQGYIKIVQTGKGRKDYKFVYRKDYQDIIHDFDKRLLEYVFNGKNEVDMEDLEYKFYRHIGEIKNLVYQSLTEKKYYTKNPQRARFGGLFVLGIIAIFASFFLGSVFTSFMLGASVFVSGVIMMVFAMFMSKKTKAGTETLRKIYGFKEFLKVTEEERLKFHNPPKMVPEIFEKYLPYAMVLGVENAWAKNFEKIYTEEPDWYQGQQVGVWNAVYLANSLSTFSNYSSSVMATAPSSSSSGGSGFSGGGVGGGGGGGGGGSW